MRKLRGLAATAVGAMGLLAPGLARAHFTLNSPPSWAVQGAQGLPEKSAPCGQADPGTPAVASNVVTTYRPGQTISVSITEDVPHPGWYSATLSQNGMNGLPTDPMVTPTTGANGSACGTATPPPTDTIVGLTPQAPGGQLLVDGALRHTSTPLNPATQSFNVTLPSNVTCTNCVLQIVEFMSNHPLNNPGGCFYHHCANIAIQGTPVDGGMSGGTDAGSDAKAGGTGGAPGTGGKPGNGTGGTTAGVGGISGGGGGGPGSAGATGSTGGAGGPAGAEGGTTGGTAGASGSEGGATGTGTGGLTANDVGGGGCSCNVASGTRNGASGLVALFLAIFLIRRRRHR